MFFTPEQAAQLAQTTVRVATLVDLEFDDAPQYLWNGNGRLDVAGHVYEGLAGFGSISGLEETRNAVSQQVTLVLSGVEGPILAMALAESDAVQGRLCVASLQLFGEDWQAVGGPIPIWFGLMQRPRVSRQAMEDEKGGTQTISLPVENLFYGRARPPAGRYTDRDQQARFPGDLFFERVASLVNKTTVWPNY